MKTQFLIKTYISREGNIYYPGEYNASNPLPENIVKDPNYVKPSVEDFVVANKPEPTKEAPSVIERETSFEKSSGLSGELTINKPIKEGDIHVKADISKEATPNININTASREEILALKGVGKSAASKIVEYRDYSPFVSYSDLTERVPLSFGNSWEKFQINFEG